MVERSLLPSSAVHVQPAQLKSKIKLAGAGRTLQAIRLDMVLFSTGARAAKVMNPGFNITAHELRVGSETEDIFGDDFYEV